MLNYNIAYVKYKDIWTEGFTKEIGGIGATLSTWTIDDLNEGVQNNNVIILEALTIKELKEKTQKEALNNV